MHNSELKTFFPTFPKAVQMLQLQTVRNKALSTPKNTETNLQSVTCAKEGIQQRFCRILVFESM